MACIYGAAHKQPLQMQYFSGTRFCCAIEGMVDNFKIQSCHGVCGSFFVPKVLYSTKNAMSFKTLEAKKA